LCEVFGVVDAIRKAEHVPVNPSVVGLEKRGNASIVVSRNAPCKLDVSVPAFLAHQNIEPIYAAMVHRWY
jgi:hypothetical protein